MANLSYINPAEWGNHLSAIHEIGDRLGIPDDSVRPVYESELERVGAEARIREFLPLVVSRIVKGLMGGRTAGGADPVAS